MKRILLVVALVSSVAPRPGFTHHFPGAEFSLAERVQLEGQVVEYHFVNPHILIVFDVITRDGETVRWLAEGANAGAMRRLGWTGRELKVGARLTIVGNPARDGSNKLNWQSIHVNQRTLVGGNGTFLIPQLSARWQRFVARETAQ